MKTFSQGATPPGPIGSKDPTTELERKAVAFRLKEAVIAPSGHVSARRVTPNRMLSTQSTASVSFWFLRRTTLISSSFLLRKKVKKLDKELPITSYRVIFIDACIHA